MKHLKKIFALAMTLFMAIAVVTPAFAAGNGTITIRNTVNDKDYNIYKVFDATYNDDGNVAYTYDGSNANFVNALQSADSPFEAVMPTGSDKYNIELKKGKGADDVATFLGAQANKLGEAVQTFKGDGDTQTITGLDYGYYYITTTTGTTATIDSAVPNVTVIDKNETITPPVKEETLDSESVENRKWTDDTDAFVGDTIYFKAEQNYVRYVGETVVTNIVLTDVMTDGLTPDWDSIAVMAGEKTLAKNTDYTVAIDANNGQKATITIPTATVDVDGENVTFAYEDGIKFTITYSAVLNDGAVIDGPNFNTITTQYNNNTNFSNNTDSTTVETYDFLLRKVDGNSEYLAGAGFRLYDALTGGNEITLAKDNEGYFVSDGEGAGVEIEVDNASGVNVRGLRVGTYYLEETTTPEGFNTLEGRREVVITAGANVPVEITVENNEGTALPSTGGIGTTLFYVIGGLMVAGAAIALVVKNRVAKIEK